MTARSASRLREMATRLRTRAGRRRLGASSRLACWCASPAALAAPCALAATTGAAGRQVPLLRASSRWRWTWCGATPASSSLGHGLFFALGGYAHGHVPDARHRPARASTGARCPTSWCSSTGSSCPGTGAVRQLRSSRRDGPARPRGSLALRLRVVRLPLAHPRRLLLDHHPGADLRGDAALLPERRPGSAATTASPTSSASSASRCTSPRTRVVLLRALGDRCCVGLVLCRLWSARARPGAHRHPRRRGTRALLRLRPARSSCSSGRSPRCCAAWPARSTCRRSGSSTPARCRPRNSIEMAIWVAVGGRGRWSAPILGAASSTARKSWLTGALPAAWLFVLGRSSSS